MADNEDEEKKKKLLKKTEATLRSVLVSSPRGVPLRRLDREYKTIVLQPIPYRELGFYSLDDFVKAIPEVASLYRDGDGEVIVKGIPCEADRHIANLIAKQRKPRIKPKAKSRRPVVVSRPMVAKTPPAATRMTPRFIPPRLMRQALDQSIGRTSVQRGVTMQVQKQIHSLVNSGATRRVELVPQMAKAPKTNPTRTVTVVHHQGESSKKGRKKKEKWTSNEPNWQGMEVSFTSDQEKPSNHQRTVTLSNSSSDRNANQNVSESTEDAEIYSKIRKLLELKPTGVWLTRIGAEYKKLYGCELPSNMIERLDRLPHVARCELSPGGGIVYPSKEQKATVNDGKQTQSAPVEIYILRPQELPQKGSTVEVSVSHVESVNHFFVHYKHRWDKIDFLQNQLAEYFKGHSSEKDNLPTLKEGMFCCAQFTEDDAWYRARITECRTNGTDSTVQVVYVDFGNCETLPVSRLRLLTREQAELPMLAVVCTLESVKPSSGDTWSNTAVERFKELCNATETLEMTVVGAEGQHVVVQLKDATGIDIKSVLLKERHAVEESDASSSTLTSTISVSSASSQSMSSSSPTSASVTSSFTAKTSPPSASDKQVNGTDERVSPARPFLKHRFFSKDDDSAVKLPETVKMPDEEFVDVFVCNVHSTDNICVNFYGEDYSDKLVAIEQSMLCHFEEPSSQETPSQVNVGSVFAVYSKEIHSEGLWYRVKVQKLKGDNAQVEFMDYGETGIVPVSNLKVIPPRFLELPFQACSLSLHGIPKTRNPDVVLKLKHMVLGKQMVAEVIKRVGDTVAVELYDMSSEVDININTVLRSLVIPDEELAPILPKKTGEQIDVFVTYVEGYKIFVQIPGGGATRLEELMTDISEHYSKPTKAAEFVSSPNPGKICCAKCSDGSWYRAVVTKLLPERQVEVQYVDYGNTEQLAISNLREPARAISHVNSLPFQVLECHLEGANETWDDELSHRLVETVMERDVALEIASFSDVPIVRLFLPSDDETQGLVNVADVLGFDKVSPALQEEAGPSSLDDSQTETLEDGSFDGDSVTSESSSEANRSQEEADRKDSNLSLPLDLSETFVDIVIIGAEDPSCFVFQCLEYNNDLETHQKKMQEHYSSKQRSPFKGVRPGVLCAVHYASDSTWYRAVVKAVLSPQQVCVRFVDYGDFDIVPTNCLQALPDEFRELPSMAVQGNLQGVEPVGDDSAEWSEEAKERFKELAVENNLVAKPKGATNHGNSFSEEPKVHVELYDTSDPKRDVVIADVLVSEGLAKRINEA